MSGHALFTYWYYKGAYYVRGKVPFARIVFVIRPPIIGVDLSAQ